MASDVLLDENIFPPSSPCSLDNELWYTEVIKFWFGADVDYSLTDLAKNLWFVAEGTQRAAVDEYIKLRFGVLLEKIEDRPQFTLETRNHDKLIASILVLDQFSRHVYRDRRDESDQKHRLEENTSKALALSRFAIELKMYRSIDSCKLCFLLMPLRHLHGSDEEKICSLKEVLEVVRKRMDDDLQGSKILARFKNATERRLGDTFRNFNTNNFSSKREFTDYEILEPRCTVVSPEHDINMPEEPIYRSIIRFLLERFPRVAELRRNPLKGTISLNIYISLSGGVDSMVIARILAHMSRSKSLLLSELHGRIRSKDCKKRKRIKETMTAYEARMARIAEEKRKEKTYERYKNVELRINVVALHIDYGNRPESHSEADFVKRWCSNCGIMYKERQMGELRRDNTDRDEYERITRELRFAFYKEILKTEDNGVIFGHHKGDVQENVISNVMKGCSIFEVSGMTKVSFNSGVYIWRPLLDHDKEEIFDFAHRYGVPYFKDSTPKWSTRGKLRGHLMPLLADIYGSGYLYNLSNLARQSDELHKILNRSLFEPFWKKVIYGQLGTIIDCKGYLEQPAYFWRHTLKKIFHNSGFTTIHEKPVEILLNLFRNIKEDETHIVWVELKADNRCFFFKNRFLTILKQNFIKGFAEESNFGSTNLFKFCVDAHQANSIRIGKNWTARIEPCNLEQRQGKNDRLDILELCKTGRCEYIVYPQTDEYKLWNYKKQTRSTRRFHKVPKKFCRGIPVLIPMKEEVIDQNCGILINLEFA